MSQPNESELSSTASDAGGLSLDEAFERLSAEPEEPKGQPEGSESEGVEHHETEVEDEGEQHETEHDEEAESEPEKEEEAEPEEPVYQVKVQGKVLNVKQTELIAGYSREADYRQKTASLAEEKTAFQQVATQRQTELATTANRLGAMVHMLGQELVGDQAELSQLLQSDPMAYVQKKAAFDAKQHRVFEAWKLVDEHQKVQAEAANQPPPPEFVKEKQEQLLNLIPEWRDPKKQDAESAMVASYLQSNGYTADELNNLYDPRAIQVARKAALFDQLQQAKAKKTFTPVVAPTPVRASAQPSEPSNGPGAKKAFDRLRRTGSLDDALAALNERQRNR